MNQNETLVSIIIPTYNRAHLIGETIQSVLEQTYSNWELLIIDDGSTDHTEDIIRQYHDKRIKYLKKKHTGFIGITRNFGINHANGALIAFLDSDDLWRKDKLALQISLLNKHPETAFILSNGDQFGEGAIQTPDYENLFVGNMFLSLLEKEAFCFYSPSFIFKKDVINKIGLMDESVPTTRDIHFCLRMSFELQGIFTNERLIKIRKHSESTSEKFNVTAYVNSLNMLREFFNKGMITKKLYKHLKSVCYYKMGLLFLKERNSTNAFKNFLNYNYLRPLQHKGWIRLLQSLLLFLTAKRQST
jgi:glycosyltransferase involved in cell wall biosynthesis